MGKWSLKQHRHFKAMMQAKRMEKRLARQQGPAVGHLKHMAAAGDTIYPSETKEANVSMSMQEWGELELYRKFFKILDRLT